MITISGNDVQLFNNCVQQLLNTFISIKSAQQELISKHNTERFRIPIRVQIAQQGKKFIVPTKIGQFIFTKREIECLQCLIDGMSAKETGNSLFLSPRTVETYLNNIKEKMQCRTKRRLVNLFYTY
jgi:DNA-binding CsgD family transcriptional regulator